MCLMVLAVVSDHLVPLMLLWKMQAHNHVVSYARTIIVVAAVSAVLVGGYV